MWTTYRLPLKWPKKKQRRDTWETKSNAVENTSGHVLHGARPHDRFPILLEPAPSGSAHNADNFRELEKHFPGKSFYYLMEAL